MTEQESGKGDTRPPRSDGDASFFAELRKRRVYRSALAYAVVAWGATEILDGVISRLGWPDWIATLVVILFVVGFPVTMFLAWVFDWTKEGIRRTEPWTATGWLSIAIAILLLVTGSAGLFWLINPSGVVRVEQTGVAVLPCRYRGDAALAFRGEGYAEIVHESLAHYSQFFVPEFSSVRALSASNPATAELGRELDVSWLVECRVVEEGQRLRIDAGLIDVSTDESEALVPIDMDHLNVIGALDAFSRAILNHFDVAERQGGPVQLADRFPSSPSALDAYLRGEQAMRSGDPGSLEKARTEFRSAQMVPGFDVARIREADSLIRALLDAESGQGDGRNDAALRAVKLMLDELDRTEAAQEMADLYVAHLRFANLSDRLGFGEPVPPEIRREWFDRAVALKPNDAEPYLLFGQYAVSQGDPEAAADYLATASHLAPKPF